MSKWYEVVVISRKVFAVEVEDDEDETAAMNYATDEVSDFIDVNCERLETQEKIELCIRHCDVELSL